MGNNGYSIKITQDSVELCFSLCTRSGYTQYDGFFSTKVQLICGIENAAPMVGWHIVDF